ncbi:hypothetical protein [Candidatus Nitrosopumilus sediminis]|uniref:Uncharacterized protein n=1 Tax=Candidatus Nitrosopumilus sediminis TaxID=1229909 RepID=K0BBR3_9ARCH|nr:hypothetical protein [Candidatus Nitrosopumilus sediminis]AFS82567.1 hypothetical protein NSED_03805 [Candidatus Nitrosopumilus sediminis]
MSVKLTDFESDLLRLSIVHNRFESIYLEYPNHMVEGRKALFLKHLFREIVVEQLHNFIKIRNDLRKNSKFEKLDEIIKIMVEPILEHKKPIKELRNNYVSHIQEGGRKFKETTNEIVLKYNFPTSFSFYQYLAGLVSYYSLIVKNNFKEEYKKSAKKYEAIRGEQIQINSGFKMKDVDDKIQKILFELKNSLEKHGFSIT